MTKSKHVRINVHTNLRIGQTLYPLTTTLCEALTSKKEKAISKKGRVIILLPLHVVSSRSRSTILPRTIKIFQGTKSISKTKQREITPKVTKPQLSFLYGTCLVLVYISSKYQQNILKESGHKINA